jgi:hypothetical protein
MNEPRWGNTEARKGRRVIRSARLIVPHGEIDVSTNRVQRHLRDISDAHMNVTALEMDCVEAARHTYRVTRAALLSGMLTVAEAREIVDGMVTTVRLAEDSLRRNVQIERQLTAFSAELAGWPSDAKARAAA